MTATINNIQISVNCPICNANKELNFPYSIINDAKQLTTVSIPSNLVCEHHFQMFIDKNFKVRGYQKVDFEIKIENLQEKNHNEDELFDNLIMEGNYLEYIPKNKTISNEIKREMTLKEIYEEFWEFIDDNNEEFKKFIQTDKRRKELKSKDPL